MDFLFHTKVTDYKQWKQEFNKLHKQNYLHKIKLLHIWQHSEHPNEIFFIFRADENAARHFFDEIAKSDYDQKAGIIERNVYPIKEDLLIDYFNN